MQHIMIIGRLTDDPELKFTPNGHAVVNFTMADNRRWKNENGDLCEETTFIRCNAWRNAATTIAEYVKKGYMFSVTGHFKNVRWEDKDGVTRYDMRLTVERFQLLDNRGLEAKKNETSKVGTGPKVIRKANAKPVSEKVDPSEDGDNLFEGVEELGF